MWFNAFTYVLRVFIKVKKHFLMFVICKLMLLTTMSRGKRQLTLLDVQLSEKISSKNAKLKAEESLFLVKK